MVQGFKSRLAGRLHYTALRMYELGSSKGLIKTVENVSKNT